jgi:UTP--glucose-1-phosphate uridylyltransferase
MSKIKKAIIPVAGFATRFLPISKAFSKALLPIVDKPVLQFLVEDAVAAGVEEIIFVVSPDQTDIQKYFVPDLALEKKLTEKGNLDLLAEIQKISKLAKFNFVIQEEMLGDGHAILQAREKIGAEAFLVLFGDDLIFGQSARQLVEVYEKENSTVIGLQKVAKSEVDKYGIVGIQEDSSITQFVEKPKLVDAPSDLAIVGKYICTPRIFEILASNPNSSGEIRLIDALAILLKEEKIFGEILTGERFDCGSKVGWLAANNFFAQQHPEILG